MDFKDLSEGKVSETQAKAGEIRDDVKIMTNDLNK